MSPATQAKLLRVLQDQQFHRLGGTKVLRTDVRIVAASNQDLEQAIRAGRFREDLYFRLNVIGIRLAPLRERSDDLEALSRHFLAEFSRQLGRPRTDFSAEALARIQAHGWPGNIRELRNAIERAVLMSDGERIEADDIGLPETTGDGGDSGWRPELPPEGVALDQVERAVVLEALRRTRYVQKEAAQLLRVSRRKLNYMIQRMGIKHPSWRRNRGDEGAASGSDSAGPVDSSAIG
jgi:DNA-binding NtrC family response regulator